MAESYTAAPSRLGKFADYLLGRNTLIGLASLMLLVISGFATWHGMRDFIIGVSTSPAAQTQATCRAASRSPTTCSSSSSWWR